MTTDSNKSSFSRDALAYVPVKIIPAITGLVSIVILTKNLTPEEYGRYSVVITSVLLLVQLAGTWLWTRHWR
jgi:O-antigen/teichoic acid export membrane protein